DAPYSSRVLHVESRTIRIDLGRSRLSIPVVDDPLRRRDPDEHRPRCADQMTAHDEDTAVAVAVPDTQYRKASSALTLANLVNDRRIQRPGRLLPSHEASDFVRAARAGRFGRIAHGPCTAAGRRA